MSHELGNEDEVVAGAHERGAEGVAQDVAGEIGAEAGLVGDREQDVVGAAGGEPVAAAVEDEGGVGLRAGPSRTFFVDPQCEFGAELGVDGDLAVAAALARAHDD